MPSGRRFCAKQAKHNANVPIWLFSANYVALILPHRKPQIPPLDRCLPGQHDMFLGDAPIHQLLRNDQVGVIVVQEESSEENRGQPQPTIRWSVDPNPTALLGLTKDRPLHMQEVRRKAWRR